MNQTLKTIGTIILGAAVTLLTACQSRVEHFTKYKEKNPTATRTDYLRTQSNAPVGYEGDMYQQRTEEKWTYHYGYNAWRGKFQWHWGYDDVKRDNTPEENKQDSLEYIKRVHDNVLRQQAYEAVMKLSITSDFTEAATADGKEKKTPDSLNVQMFARDIEILADAAVENGVSIKTGTDIPKDGDKKPYKENFENLLLRVRAKRGEEITIGGL